MLRSVRVRGALKLNGPEETLFKIHITESETLLLSKKNKF
jgi:hypothetical protein